MMMLQRLRIVLFVGIFLLFAGRVALAQETTPRPTPTNVSLVAPSTDEPGGSIRGAVYRDVNADGRCVGTGVAGEEPLVGVPIEFVSSDQRTTETLYTGSDGTYGLVATGYSYWAVTVRPGSEWVVTSERTQHVPIFADSLIATNVNFCLQQGALALVVLPASGAPASAMLWQMALFGAGLIVFGAGLEWRRRAVRNSDR
jgi:hypothetical protein